MTRWSLLIAVLLLPRPLAAQTRGCWATQPASPDSATRRAALGHRTAHAVHIEAAPPAIDGRLNETAWCEAPAATYSIIKSPAPGRVASLPTVTRVLYDDDAVYFAVRLWDPHPDSILAPFPRRDDENISDWVFVELDTRHDRRSGFSFGLNPRGVQVDGLWSDDVNYDPAWNGVWQGASARDPEGWTAEFRIPYSELALASGAAGTPLTWGLNVYRYTPHRGESSNWSPRLPSVAGVVSHFNDLDGIVAPPGHSRVDVRPYVSVTGSRASETSDARAAVGTELRYRPSSSTRVALSLHPDFGQVEADPSQVNLTTFETFLPEQRPLFLESAQLLQFGTPLDYESRGTSFDEEAPFYSRRIGRNSTVLGALRVSGRSANGWSGGLLDAWTDSRADPLTHFAAARLMSERTDGRAALGMIGTWTHRFGMDGNSASRLADNALAIGADGRLRFGDDAWQLSGSMLASRVAGDASMIRSLEFAHGYARPDSVRELSGPLDSAHSLTGVAMQGALDRTSGNLTTGLSTRLVSRGFELNDLGFQRNSDWLLVAAHWQWLRYRPGHLIRRWSVGSSQLGAGWTLGGLRRSSVANLTGALDFRNYWGSTFSWDHELPATDPGILRGGPAFRLPARERYELTGHTDSRKRWQVTLGASAEREPATASWSWRVTPDFFAFVTDRLQLGLTPLVGQAREAWQYVTTAEDSAGTPHYILGRLHQTTASLTVRGTYAFSPHLTIQLYSQLFLSDGWFDALKEVKAPRDPEPARRVSALGAAPGFEVGDPDFSDRELHLNLLLRWELLPGSTLFLVWTHARSADAPSRFSLGDDVSALVRGPAENALQAKVSYWIGGLGGGG
ncbi:MAG TPA: DUF5916 domain-containing protein [Gemmatimonadales bacterium]|jgi:hypothetical protein|nr:DUF5916 domain-containing protein [Gemmatimonadales bacterium]